MVPVVTFVCWMAAQQLSATPFPAEVGEPVTVRLVRNVRNEPLDQVPLARDPLDRVALRPASHVVPLAGQRIEVELPDGQQRFVGVTDADGALRFVPDQAGAYVWKTAVDGVRLLAPHRVIPARSRWLVAAVCVPLGLLLLWRNLRRFSSVRGRHDL